MYSQGGEQRLYSAILIDMFNLAYRKNTPMLDYLDTANAVINFINSEAIPRLEKDGKLYLLFDCLPKSDMGMGKNFKYHPDRRDILPSYKKGRVHSGVVYNALVTLRKYYTYRGDNIKVVISNMHEADDFVEGLLKIESKGDIALVTNDSDWSRYIDDRVSMIKMDFKTPYTKEDYFVDYGMVPTVASITLKKAIFGDSTDNIPNVFLGKKAKVSKEVILSYISQVAQSGMTIEELKNELFHVTYQSMVDKVEKTPIQNILLILNMDSAVMESFTRNFRVVESRCKDVSKYITSHPENKSYNNLMDTMLHRIVSASGAFHFGARVGKKKRINK